MTGRVVCRLSTLLGERKWKMMDLARATGLSKTTIFQLYHEKATRIDLDTVAKVCKALGCQVGDLLVFMPDSMDDQGTGHQVLKPSKEPVDRAAGTEIHGEALRRP